MKLEIDARGLACPEPVLKAKHALDSQGPKALEIWVDNPAAVENLTRFLEGNGYAVDSRREGDDFWIQARADQTPTEQNRADKGLEKKRAHANSVPRSPETTDEHPQKILVLIPTDRMGFGDDELGKKLMVSFIKTLKEMGPDLWQLILVNNGVKLTIEGSPVLDALREYEAHGLQILVCGTCLSHFDLLSAKQVGQTTNMLDIVTAMQLADKVIQPG